MPNRVRNWFDPQNRAPASEYGDYLPEQAPLPVVVGPSVAEAGGVEPMLRPSMEHHRVYQSETPTHDSGKLVFTAQQAPGRLQQRLNTTAAQNDTTVNPDGTMRIFRADNPQDMEDYRRIINSPEFLKGLKEHEAQRRAEEEYEKQIQDAQFQGIVNSTREYYRPTAQAIQSMWQRIRGK